MNKANTFLYHLLFIDIETVPQFQHFDQLSENWRQLFCDKTAKIMPEDSSLATLYTEKAGILAEFGKIICISLGYLFEDEQKIISFKAKSIADDDEKIVLETFVDVVKRFQLKHKDFQFAGHNIREFDIPYISRRMIINEMLLPDFLPHSGAKPWEVQMFDTLQYWKFGDYKNYISLDLMANVLNVPTSKDDISGKDVAKVYYEEKDLTRIAKYCAKDIAVVANICLRLQQLPILPSEKIILDE